MILHSQSLPYITNEDLLIECVYFYFVSFHSKITRPQVVDSRSLFDCFFCLGWVPENITDSPTVDHSG